jgi:hypothetical protein
VRAAGQRALGHLAAILDADVDALQDRSGAALPALPESAA